MGWRNWWATNNELKQYFATDNTIQSNPVLKKLGGFLVNKCDLKLENWETAIIWYEDIILNPESMEDSIFAIIDLGYAYLLMENGGYKSAFTGKLPEHKPVTAERYIGKREYLLSLIPGDQLSETMKEGINKLNGGE